MEASILLLKGYLIGVELVYSCGFGYIIHRSPLRGVGYNGEKDWDPFYLLVESLFVGKLSIILP